MQAQCAGGNAMRALLVGAAVIVVASTQTASAQTIPGQIDPGQIERRFEEPAQPRSGFEPVVPAPGQQPTPDQAKEIKFVLQGVAPPPRRPRHDERHVVMRLAHTGEGSEQSREVLPRLHGGNAEQVAPRDPRRCVGVRRRKVRRVD